MSNENLKAFIDKFIVPRIGRPLLPYEKVLINTVIEKDKEQKIKELFAKEMLNETTRQD